MKIDWINHDDSLGAVTIYDNNIRLSKQAASFFVDAYAVAIGVDRDTKALVIKNISKDDVLSQNLEKSSLHHIAFKPSYGRITGKQMIDELSNKLNLDFTKQAAFKFNARWNTGDKMLIVSTKGDKANA